MLDEVDSLDPPGEVGHLLLIAGLADVAGDLGDAHLQHLVVVLILEEQGLLGLHPGYGVRVVSCSSAAVEHRSHPNRMSDTALISRSQMD